MLAYLGKLNAVCKFFIKREKILVFINILVYTLEFYREPQKFATTLENL
jgi:hypothetical protein